MHENEPKGEYRKCKGFYNEAWAGVEMFRWQYGEMPQGPDDMRPIDEMKALGLMAEAVQTGEANDLHNISQVMMRAAYKMASVQTDIEAALAEIECLKEQETLIAVEATELTANLAKAMGKLAALGTSNSRLRDKDVRLREDLLTAERQRADSRGVARDLRTDLDAARAELKDALRHSDDLLNEAAALEEIVDDTRAEVERLNTKLDFRMDENADQQARARLRVNTIAALRAQVAVKDGLLKNIATDLTDAMGNWGTLDNEERLGTVDEAHYQIEAALTAAPSPLAVVEDALMCRGCGWLGRHLDATAYGTGAHAFEICPLCGKDDFADGTCIILPRTISDLSTRDDSIVQPVGDNRGGGTPKRAQPVEVRPTPQQPASPEGEES